MAAKKINKKVGISLALVASLLLGGCGSGTTVSSKTVVKEKYGAAVALGDRVNTNSTSDKKKDKEENEPDKKDEEEVLLAELGWLKQAESAEEIYNAIYDRNTGYGYDYGWDYGLMDGGLVYEEATNDVMAPAPMAPVTDEAEVAKPTDAVAKDESFAEADDSDFSSTILQSEGVDEADVIKTDGKYIYTLTQDKDALLVLDAKDLSVVSKVILEDIDVDKTSSWYYWGDDIDEFYLCDDKIVFVYDTSEKIETGGYYRYPYYWDWDWDYYTEIEDDIVYEEDIAEEATKEEALIEPDVVKPIAVEPPVYGNINEKIWVPTYSYVYTTKAKVYDLSDKENPTLLTSMEQDGSYVTSRMIANKLYIQTSQYTYDTYIADDIVFETEDDFASILPKVNDDPVDCCDIYYGDGGYNWTMITSFDISEGDEIDSKLIYDYGKLYMTTSSIYLYTTDYKYESNKRYEEDYDITRLCRFDIDNGKITPAASTEIMGDITDTFAIHQAGDYTYVLTEVFYSYYNYKNGKSIWDRYSNVYVLDKDFEVAGEIDKIAKNESIYAARFFGDIGYFVTYRNMDPLFTVDFSNPYDPKIIGELEIPGFSDYLQAWGDNYLLGIGEERDEKSNFIGIKVSIFDITDPTNVVERSKTVINAHTAQALYDYKKLLASEKKGIVGFTARNYSWSYYDYKDDYCAYIFDIEDGKCVDTTKIDLGENYSYSWNSDSILYIGDTLYVSRGDKLMAYDMVNEYEKVCECDL